MKKKNLKIIVCVVMMIMLVVFGACAGSAKEDDRYPDMEALVNSEEMQEALRETIASMEESGTRLQVSGEENRIIYSYQIENIEVTEELTETFKAELAKEEAAYMEDVIMFKEGVIAENPTIVVEYFDM